MDVGIARSVLVSLRFFTQTFQFGWVIGRTPGYESEVIFADGTFIDGCTSELSADGPLRAPHVVYCQGGTHWTHWQNVVLALSRKLQL